MNNNGNKYELVLVKCAKCDSVVKKEKSSIAYKGGEPFVVCFDCLDQIMEDYRKKYSEL